MIETKDVAWLAGLLEGEGCFSTADRSKTQTITLHMTDRDVVERAAVLLGGGCRVAESARFGDAVITSRKTSFRFSVTGQRAAAWMMTLYPFMGERRRARIRELLAAWKSRAVVNRDKAFCKRGHPFEGANVRSHPTKNRRNCRTCIRDWNRDYMRRKRAEARGAA